ncbi:GNAT family N-acetyltransferase [Hoeflea sp.]|uniref:GNAT family N-acetyltransferase n=1 Tax=Hoeflea sp. TaxID=1940281 RepID=UPI003B51DC73
MTAQYIENGLRLEHREDAAFLFWEAFKAKLGPVMRSEDRAIRYLRENIDAAHAISAVSDAGVLLGVVGYKTGQGGFVGGGLKEFCSVYGWFGGLWRGLVLSTLDRPLEAGTLLMDGIFVAQAARGTGVGTMLLDAVKSRARQLGCSSVRLDVIDTNPRARALYERQGFVAVETRETGLFRHVFGFRSSTRMVCAL